MTPDIGPWARLFMRLASLQSRDEDTTGHQPDFAPRTPGPRPETGPGVLDARLVNWKMKTSARLKNMAGGPGPDEKCVQLTSVGGEDDVK